MVLEGFYVVFCRFFYRLLFISYKVEIDKLQMYINFLVRLRVYFLYCVYIEYIIENFKIFIEIVKIQYKGVIVQRIWWIIEYENMYGYKLLIRFLQSLQNVFLRRKGMGFFVLFVVLMFLWNEEIIIDQEILRFSKFQMLICRFIIYWVNLKSKIIFRKLIYRRGI